MGGVQPALPTVASLIEALYAIAAERKILVVIDEFPYLLPARDRDRDTVLTEIQAVMEERDASQLKLMVCGSYIGQMTKLLRGSLRGRLTALAVDPLSFADAKSFFSDDASAGERIERYAVGGGMSLYLNELARGRSLRRCICNKDPTTMCRLFRLLRMFRLAATSCHRTESSCE
jgi:predicted AAA+ superfamily ATPase